ncbi:MAG: glutamine synthetase III [Deferribacteraceae bacterium]|jgi:glutamine synthetase|nr:glutamine synthetase III [Deferribacteraceae bacterium]
MNKRFEAVGKIAEYRSEPLLKSTPSSVDNFGEDVFNSESITKYLSKPTAQKLLDTINNRNLLDPAIAPEVAHALKEWAIERGATHYTHWFQPLNGATAEKHDSFLELKGDQGIFSFSAKNLIVGEPDASSFPSGGLRYTFEARGYTAWDPTSPAFIRRHTNGATLCIPTAFCSYSGEALDQKTPLLRSIQSLSIAVKRLMKLFNQPDGNVKATLGPEQEYFLIDKHFYLHRADLLQTGRTLFGVTPPKHQQLEDHYFGSIKKRILAFMTDVEKELWSLGIPAKTRHNEVSPAQFELAAIFEELNLAVDHNMLVMEVLKEAADRHGLVCLLHEKPFAGVNGSGKHNNWSINYGGTNLLDPGDTPHQNAIFLTVLASIIMAIDKHSDLLRVSVIGAGNDHRLGANEAPPAIISIYVGDQLAEIIEQLEKGAPSSSKSHGPMRIGVDTLPALPKDATDRNRTSPFAFTGNKFEFRAPGSGQSCSHPMTILNTIVASAMDEISDKLEKLSASEFNSGLQKALSEIVHSHKRIIFNGDNYTADWKIEAAKRALPNDKSTMEALKALTAKKNIEMFEKYNVYNKRELESRYEVFMEEYHKKIRIEGEIALDIARSMILPAVIKEYSEAVAALAKAGASGVSEGTTALKKNTAILGNSLDELNQKIENMAKAVKGLHEEILCAMGDLRLTVDRLEGLVRDEFWPLPKYREMLFIY